MVLFAYTGHMKHQNEKLHVLCSNCSKVLVSRTLQALITAVDVIDV